MITYSRRVLIEQLKVNHTFLYVPVYFMMDVLLWIVSKVYRFICFSWELYENQTKKYDTLQIRIKVNNILFTSQGQFKLMKQMKKD